MCGQHHEPLEVLAFHTGDVIFVKVEMGSSLAI